MLFIAFTFALFQALMPLIGYFAGQLFVDFISVFVPYIALLLLLSTTLLTGCDIPDVDFYERSYEVSAAGGEMIIPVNSTGLDEVGIKYYGSNNKDWCEVVEIIDHYDMTRALAEWDSGIKISFTPN